MSLTECLQEALRDAMRERDRTLVSALRSTLAALANAEAVPASRVDEGSAHVAGAAAGVGAAEAQRRTLTQDQVRSIVGTEIEELAAHASHLDDMGRHAQAVDVRRARDHLASLLANCHSCRHQP